MTVLDTAPNAATLLLPHDADREEWLAARRKGVTASEIAAILGLSPWESTFGLYWKKLGVLSEDYDDDVLSLGRHLEPWIADRWAEDHPEFVVRPSGLYANRERSWQLCTPDRDLYYEQSETVQHVLEIKSSGSYDGWGEDGTDEIPVYYRAQVLWQLDTLGLTEAHVTCFFLSSRSRRDYVVRYDTADVELMRKAALEFLDRLKNENPPPVDDHTATADALKALYPLDEDAPEAEIPAALADEYERARAAYTLAESRKSEAEARLRAAMGTAKRAVSGGQKVASRSVYERAGVDAKRLRAEHPAAYAACRTTSVVDRLNPTTKKKESK